MTTGQGLRGRTVAGLLGAVTAMAVSVCACGVGFAGGGSPGVTSSGIDVCELASPSQVAAVTGHKVVHVRPGRSETYPNQGPNIFTCVYHLSSGNRIFIQVTTVNSKLLYGADVANLSGSYPATRLHGIGDQAAGSRWGLAVLDGKYTILIRSDYPNQWYGRTAGLIGLARSMISALG